MILICAYLLASALAVFVMARLATLRARTATAREREADNTPPLLRRIRP
jgi:hypothetical protein